MTKIDTEHKEGYCSFCNDIIHHNANDAELREQFEHISSYFLCSVVAVNHLALMCLDRAVVRIGNSPYFKHEVKAKLRNVVTAAKAYISVMKEAESNNKYGNRNQFLEDYLRENYSNIKPKVDLFRLQLLQYLYKTKVKEAELKADIALAKIMLEYASVFYDMFWDSAYKQVHVTFNRNWMARCSLKKLHLGFDYVADKICGKEDIDFDRDYNCHNAFNIIQNEMASTDIINKSGLVALDFNEDVKEWAEEKEII